MISLSEPLVPPEPEQVEAAPPIMPEVPDATGAAPVPPPKPRLWSIWGALLLFLGFFAAQVVAAVPVVIGVTVVRSLRGGAWAETWSFPLVLVASMGATVLLLFLVRRRGGAKPLWDSRDLRDGRAWALAGAILLVCYGANILRIWLEPEPSVPELNQQMLSMVAQPEAIAWLPLALTGICIVILAPLTEEWLFRGILQPAIYRRVGDRFGAWVAIPVTGLIFGLVHGLGAWWVAGVYGVGIGWLSLRQRSLALPMLVHGVLNFTVFAMVIWGGMEMR